MQTSEQEPSKYRQPDRLPVGNDTKVKNYRHQPVPEPHDNCAEEECQRCKSDYAKDYPSGPVFRSAAEAPVFIIIFCCFHDFHF
jgi:hypothetical protein